MKYFNRYRNKRELIQAIKYAESNQIFFSRDTMSFFGPQKFRIVQYDYQEGFEWLLAIDFTGRCQRTAYYSIDPVTLKLNSFHNMEMVRVS